MGHETVTNFFLETNICHSTFFEQKQMFKFARAEYEKPHLSFLPDTFLFSVETP